MSLNHAENIARTGLSIMGVMSSNTGPGFNYTIGLTESYRHPELLVFAIRMEYAAIIFNELASRIKAGLVIKDGDVIADLANFPVAFKAVTLDAASKFAYQTLFHYEGTAHQPTFLQIVLTDAKGNFPWDPFYLASMKPKQPELWA